MRSGARARGVLVVAAALFALHMALAGRYGIFRDELYYAACGEHLAFGYVDHPPLVALMAKLSRVAFGQSLYGLRLWPALAAAITVVITADLARRMGGGAFAQLVAAAAIALSPELLGTDHFLSMNCVLPVAWGAGALFALRAVETGSTRAWLAFGAACGVGLLAKHSTLFFGAAMTMALLATPHRRVFATRGPWLAFAVAAASIALNVIWEMAHGWPTLEFMHNAQTHKMVRFGALDFAGALILTHGPATLPLWGGGAVWLLAADAARPFRFLGLAFLLVLGIVLMGGGKTYYALAAFPIAYAAGGALVERAIARAWARWSVLAAMTALGIPLVPLALPVLEPAAFVRYQDALGVRPKAEEKNALGAMPQHLADQIGWEPLAAKVAAAYATLTPEERSRTAIFGRNYGEAGAVDWFGARWGLPHAVSGHNSYFMWGPPEAGRGDVLIAITHDREGLEKTYERVEAVEETSSPYAMPFENHLPIFICRGRKRDIRVIWPETKMYI